MTRSPGKIRRHRAFTLLETVISIALLSVIMGSLMSVMVLATHALPDPDDPSLATADINSAFEFIMADAMLAGAIAVDATNLKLAVPDRDNDGERELICYGLGNADSPPTYLYRTINNSAENTLVENVRAFKASVVSYEGTSSLLIVEIATSRGDIHRASIDLIARPEIAQ